MHEKEENQIRIFYTKSLIRKLYVKNPIKKGNVAHRTQETSHTEHRKRIYWTVLLKWIFNNLVGGMEWLGLARYRDMWLAWSGWVWLRIGASGWHGVVGCSWGRDMWLAWSCWVWLGIGRGGGYGVVGCC